MTGAGGRRANINQGNGYEPQGECAVHVDVVWRVHTGSDGNACALYMRTHCTAQAHARATVNPNAFFQGQGRGAARG